MKRLVALALASAMMLSMVACGGSSDEGKYTASGTGMNGDVSIEMVIEESVIKSVTVLDGHKETAGICEAPIAQIPQAIVDNQSINIDVISGATLTSNAILTAAEDCLTQAGLDVSNFQGKAEKETAEDVEMTADVIIVGAGGAGLAAAVSATDAGASVIVIEKMGAAGGNTIVSGGIYNAPDEVRQGAQGIEDSPELFFKHTYEGGDSIANTDLVEVFTENAYDGIEWLEDLGLVFNDEITQGAGSLYQRTHSTTELAGSGYIRVYLENLESKEDQFEIMYNTTGEDLIVDENGAVTGVIATGANGETVTLNANKNVILASGGFSANVELREEYNTSGKWSSLGAEVLTTNTPGITGDGIIMASEAGADLVDMEQIQMLYLGEPEKGTMTKYTPKNLSGTDQILFVNLEGERFVREDGRRDEICGALLAQTDGLMYIVESMDGSMTVDMAEMTLADGTPIAEAEVAGNVLIADTLEELAEKIGCDAETLKATFETFNQSVASKTDEFGRELFSVELVTGPFIATPRVAAVHHTMGGIRIDTECQVLDADGNVIPGLIAAGEITGGIHGSNRLGGNAIVDTVVFGKIAGETAAK